LVVAEIDPPETRGRRQKLDSNTLATFARIALINHAAFLFFVGNGIYKYEQFAIIDFMFKEQQAALGVNHDSLAGFLKLAPVVSSSMSLKAHLEEDATAATPRFRSDSIHASFLNCAAKRVNCTDEQVWRTGNQSSGES
jgi:hypothetical protein